MCIRDRDSDESLLAEARALWVDMAERVTFSRQDPGCLCSNAHYDVVLLEGKIIKRVDKEVHKMEYTDPAHRLVEAHPYVLIHEDVDLIQELVRKLPKNRHVEVVDLGAGSGTTALSVLCARPNRILVTTVDHSTLQWAQAVSKNIGRAEDWRGIMSDSAEAAKEFKAGSVDLLMIDTDHTYKTTKGELKAWLPKIIKGGFVWLHNYADPADLGVPNLPSPGVKQAIDEVVAAGQLELVKVGGLGWAGRKPIPARPQYPPKKGEKRA